VEVVLVVAVAIGGGGGSINNNNNNNNNNDNANRNESSPLLVTSGMAYAEGGSQTNRGQAILVAVL